MRASTLNNTTRLLLLALTAALVAVLAFPATALGCSCVPHDDLAGSVRNQPAAMVGTVIGTELEGSGPFGDMVRTRIMVEKWVKADLGDVIDIRTVADGGAACGLGWMDAGTRLGLLLTVQDDILTSNLCLWVDADELALIDLAGDQGVPAVTRDEVRVRWDRDPSPVARAAFLGIVGAAGVSAVVTAWRRRRAAQVPE
jgi:hypothetical protein